MNHVKARGSQVHDPQDVQIPKRARRIFDHAMDSVVTRQEENESKSIAEPWRTAYEQTRSISTKAYIKLMELRQRFSATADQLRLARNQSQNPHPRNIHLVTSSSQYFPTSAADVDVAPNIRLMTGLLQSCDSMAEVIEKACLSSYIPEPQEGKLYIPPIIEKPVSSRGANRCQGWKKLENNDPNIRRVVIMLTVDYGDNSHLASKEMLKTAYLEAPIEEPNTKNLFRVDKIIEFAMPSKEETARGVTIKDKIKKAFEDAQTFVAAEKAKCADLKFEGVAHWVGHGRVQHEYISKKSDLFYKDGSLDFAFLANHRGDEISKDEIKSLERTLLKDFNTFIQHFKACNSGAMIS